MLNLTYIAAYQYTKDEKIQLLKLRKKYGRHFQNPHPGKVKKMVWYDGENATVSIKNKISKNSLLFSRFRCSYCEKRLDGSTKPIDHFIPNTKYPKYSFHPLNLVPSCSYCNSDLKGEYNPIITANKKYKKIVFSIVHPILHEVSNHFLFEAHEGINYDIPNCSNEAKETIKIFNWKSLEHTTNRAANKILEIMQPLNDNNLMTLINECATYQPKKK